MKILDLTEFYSVRGGVRNHLDAKGRILSQLGHHHVIVAPGPKDELSDLAPAEVAEPGTHPAGSASADSSGVAGRVPAIGSARVYRVAGPTLPYDSNYHLLWRLDKVRKFVKLERPDVLEINSPYLAALALRGLDAGAVGIKAFWWHADVIDTYAAQHLTRWFGRRGSDMAVRPLWGILRAIAEGCDATFAASRHQTEKLRARGMPRVFHIPFGIDKETFHPKARSEAWRIAHGGGDPSGARVLVAMGRLSVEKLWPVVVEGFLRYREKSDARLIVLGDGPERARLERMARGRADITFLGFVSDRGAIARALASADAFVHGCPFETFGLSVAQALASGTPIIVPDQGGAAELAHPDYAELYESGNPAALAGALERWSKRDAATMRDAAARARQNIGGAIEQVERTVDVYRDLLAARRAAERGAS